MDQDVKSILIFPSLLQPHTVHVEVEWLRSPTKLETKWGPAERRLVKVADASSDASVAFWRDASRRLEELQVRNGSFLEVTGVTKTGTSNLNTTSK
jgi:hypothetical protein